MNGDTLIVVIVIGLSAVVMLIYPLTTMADRTDDMAQTIVETAVAEVVDKVTKTGEFTLDDYGKLQETINSTGIACEIEVIHGILDENPSKKTTQANSDKIGENVYVYHYTAQNLEILEEDGSILLKVGDNFSLRVKSTSPSLWQQLTNANDIYVIYAEDSGMATVNGK